MIYFIIFLILLLIITIYFLYKFVLIVLELQDVLNESFDLLDRKINIISKILETPVFFDSSEVKRILKELESTKSLIIYIANKLANALNKKAIIDDDE